MRHLLTTHLDDLICSTSHVFLVMTEKGWKKIIRQRGFYTTTDTEKKRICLPAAIMRKMFWQKFKLSLRNICNAQCTINARMSFSKHSGDGVILFSLQRCNARRCLLQHFTSSENMTPSVVHEETRGFSMQIHQISIVNWVFLSVDWNETLIIFSAFVCW